MGGLITGVVMASAGPAAAYFSSTGTGTGGASVGSLDDPTAVTASATGTDVTISWTGVTPPGTGTVGYYLERSVDTGSGYVVEGYACATSPSALLSTTSCSETVVTGTYRYEVIAVWRSWTSSALSNSVTVVEAEPELTATSTELTSSTNPATLGSPVAFTATVRYDSKVRAGGAVWFLNGDTLLGTATLNGRGRARFATDTLPAGSHPITAVYQGDASFAPSASATLVEVVDRRRSTTVLTTTPDPSEMAQVVTLTAAVTSRGRSEVLSGTVTFSDGASVIGVAAVDDTGHARFSTPALPAGSHDLTASYSGDSTFAPSTSDHRTHLVQPAASTTVVTSSQNPVSDGDTVTFTAAVTGRGGTPTGPVRFTAGTTELGSALLDAAGQAQLTAVVGPQTGGPVTASYEGDAAFAGSSASFFLLVGRPGAAPATTTLSVAAPSHPGAPLVLVATVSGSDQPPTGSVTFFDGSVVLGTVALDPFGTAVLELPGLAPGAHYLAAGYSGDPSYNPSVSAPVGLT